MTKMTEAPSRRSFLIGAAASLIAAPAIVRAGMPVKSMPAVDVPDLLNERMNAAYALTKAHMDAAVYGHGYMRVSFDKYEHVELPGIHNLLGAR